MLPEFSHSPSPAVLDWLVGGQLISRGLRAVRLWVILRHCYGLAANSPDRPGAFPSPLPDPFRYVDLRDRLFAPAHPTVEATLSTPCPDPACLCHCTTQDLLAPAIAPGDPATMLRPIGSGMAPVWTTWRREWGDRTGLAADHPGGALSMLAACPFATVHRSLREDLKVLVQGGWLVAVERGYYRRRSPEGWPVPPRSAPVSALLGEAYSGEAYSGEAHLGDGYPGNSHLSEILQTLDKLADILPECAVLADRLWQDWNQQSPGRIFLHFDYVLSEADRDRVDDYQAQLMALWQQDSGAIAFPYWRARYAQVESVITYPVCLHYVRRAKYVTGYGVGADGRLAWHNYRMDRIQSARLTVVPWGDRAMPRPLQRLHDQGQLPTSQTVQAALDQAWGFNFYLPKAWFLIRFPAWFARGYVDRTERHPTFVPIAHADIPDRVRQVGLDPAEQAQVLALVARRSPDDVYYQGWVRVGDINLLMRLRDWRPLGETLAPLTTREQMITEANQELTQYHQ